MFATFCNDFRIDGDDRLHHLQENRRCPPAVLGYARRLISLNEQLFKDRTPQETNVESGFPVVALTFDDDEEEAAWITRDLNADHAESDGEIRWGDVGLLYRTHRIGSALESAIMALRPNIGV